MHTIIRTGTLVLLAGDLAILLSSLVATLAIRYQTIPSEEILHAHLTPFLLLFCIWVLVFFIAGLYDKQLFFSRKQIAGLVFRTQLVNVLIAAVWFFVLPFGIEPKTNLVIYLLVSTLAIVVWRLYLFPLLLHTPTLHILVVGNSSEALGVVRIFADNPYFQNISASLFDPSSADHAVTTLLHRVDEEKADIIIADMQNGQVAALAKEFYSLVFINRDVQFFELSTIYERLNHRIPPSLIEETWFLENVTTNAPHYAYDFLKRVIDILGAVVLLIPCLVIFPLVAVAIKLQDGGAIFYRTQRTGQFNRPVWILKFRTMTGMDDGAVSLGTSHTVTPLGVFLRKSRIDELPQLLNVLKGDLSFIGPRPEFPARAEVYATEIPYYNMRHLIKPGLSGWAQINKFEVPRGDIDVPLTVDKLSFDLYYLKHRSLFLDIEIFLKTVHIVLMRTGT